MRRSTVLDLSNLKFLDFFRKNHTMLLLSAVFIIGAVTGTAVIRHSSISQQLAGSVFKDFVAARSGGSFMHILLDSASSSLLFLLAVFLSGASLLGAVIVPLLVCFRGFMYGIFSSYLYSSFSLKGIAFNAIVVIPPAVICLIGILLAARESIGFSAVLARLTLPKSRPLNLNADFRNYCGRYALLCVVILAAAVADSVLSCSVMHYFEF